MESSAIYLDHNATTPVDPRVRTSMLPFLEALFGNPSSVDHEHGHAAQVAVEAARELVARAIGARAGEIVFTGSCTEANNLAVLGLARAHPDKRHLITTAIEHPSVLEPCRHLATRGWRLTELPVDADGRVTAEQVGAAISPDTLVVSVQGANNEVGTIQPLAEIGAVCEQHGVYFHSDLAQFAAYGDLDIDRLGLHLASLSAHKAYGPKGVGALYIRSRRPRVKLAPLLFGGGQERGLRPGTLNTAGIVGMGEAFRILGQGRAEEAFRLRQMCDRFRDAFVGALDRVQLNGHPQERLPNNLSFSVDGVEPLALMRRVNGRLSFSASSACVSDKIQTSPVLLAMFGDTARARQAFRLAPGRFTTRDEMDQALATLIAEIGQLRGVSRAA